MTARMQPAKRRRTSWAVAASLIAHVAVGVFLLAQHPTLQMRIGEQGPPQAIIPILLMPKTPPPSAGKPMPVQPIRLHRRPQPFVPPDVTPAPIAPPTPPAAAPAAPPAPKALPSFHPAPMPEGPKGEVRTVLRQSAVGCANPNAVGLTRAERDLCDEHLGKGAKDAPFIGLGLAADKQRAFDAAAAKKESDHRYKYGPSTQGVPIGSLGVGMSAEERCASLGVSPEECGGHSKH
jgi:hypothetical protein